MSIVRFYGGSSVSFWVPFPAFSVRGLWASERRPCPYPLSEDGPGASVARVLWAFPRRKLPPVPLPSFLSEFQQSHRRTPAGSLPAVPSFFGFRGSRRFLRPGRGPLPGPVSVADCFGIFVVLSSAIRIYLLLLSMKKGAQLFS